MGWCRPTGTFERAVLTALVFLALTGVVALAVYVVWEFVEQILERWRERRRDG